MQLGAISSNVTSATAIAAENFVGSAENEKLCTCFVCMKFSEAASITIAEGRRNVTFFFGEFPAT